MYYFRFPYRGFRSVWRCSVRKAISVLCGRSVRTELTLRNLKVATVTRVLLAVIAVALCQSVSARDQVQHEFDLPVQPLEEALNGLSEQADILVLFRSGLVNNRLSAPVVGSFTIKQALNMLLKDSGLTGGLTEMGVITISAVAPTLDKPQEQNMGNNNRKTTLAKGLTGILSALLGTSVATVTHAADDNRSKLEEVVITASRVKRGGFEAPTPVTVITEQSLQNTGTTNLADILNTMPAFAATISSASTGLSSSLQGANLLDLRGLGANRTLVLVNGRRHVAGFDSGSVDVNVIPSIAVKRVEVVTGGASAAWGSDAVAGVVNFIYDKDLDGLKVESQYGITGEGDNDTYRLAAAYGTETSDGRGRLLIAAEYNKSDGIGSQHTRDWGRKAYALVSNPADTGPSDGIASRMFAPDSRLFFATTGGAHINFGPGRRPELGNIEFGPGGEVIQRDVGEVRFPWTVGGSGTDFTELGTLIAATERKNLMAAYDFELTDNINFFFEGSFATSQAVSTTIESTSFVHGNVFGYPMLSGNPFIPASVQATMDANGIDSFGLVRSNADLGTIGGDSTHDTYRSVFGFNGEFGDNWSWEVYYQHGENTFTNIRRDNIVNGRFFAAIDVITDPVTGQPVCRSGGSCVPLNLFGNGSPSQAAIDYVTGDEFTRTEISQDVFSGSVSGDLMEIWAGPISASFGAEYRKEELDTKVGAAPEGGYIIGNNLPMKGDFDVTEAFAEVVVPLLAPDSVLGNSLEFNGAIRLTDYSTSGNVTTWKAGLTYQPIDTLRFRAALSLDIRAPNIGELFTSEFASFGEVDNHVTGLRDRVRDIRRGNLDLVQEEADTTTVGLIYTPDWIEGLQVSVDWYDIDISDAIDNVDKQRIVDNCQLEGIAQFCDAIVFGPNGEVTDIFNQVFNVAVLHSEGIDVELRYALTDNLSLQLFGGYILKKEISPDGDVFRDFAGTVRNDSPGLPELKLAGSVSYDKGPLGLFGQVRYIGSAEFDASWGPEELSNSDNNISGQAYVDLSGRYTFEGNSSYEIFAGVKNLLDNDPPITPRPVANNVQTNTVIYDVIGRYFYLGLRAKF